MHSFTEAITTEYLTECLLLTNYPKVRDLQKYLLSQVSGIRNLGVASLSGSELGHDLS